MLGWIKYLRRVRVETAALKRNKDLASTRTHLSLVRDEGVAGSNPATPTSSTTKALIGRSYLQTLIN
jgi:hypothetical protein